MWLERILERVALFPMRWAWQSLLAILIISLMLLLQVKQLNVDTSLEGFLDESNAEHQEYIEFRTHFGLGEYLIIFFESDDVFDLQFVDHLKDLHYQLEKEVTYLESIESIIDTRYGKSVDDVVSNATLIPEQYNQQILTAASRIATTDPIFLNRLVNKDATATAMLIKLQPVIYNKAEDRYENILKQDMLTSIRDINNVIKTHQANFRYPIRIGGAQAAAVELYRVVLQDLTIFSLVALVVIALFLWLFFRRVTAVVLPLLLLIFSITITMSIMFVGRFPIQVTGALLPSFLLVICVGDSVHFLRAFYRFYDQGQPKSLAIKQAICHTIVPMFYSTLTTSIGLLSFSLSDVAPVANFGLFSAMGVWIALLLTYIGLPALLLYCPVVYGVKKDQELDYYKDYTIKWIEWLSKHARAVVGWSCVVSALMFVIACNLELSHDPLLWFDENNEFRQSTEIIDDRLTGTMSVDLLIDTHVNNGVYNPELLRLLDQWITDLQQQDFFGVELKSVSSILITLKEFHRLMSEADTQSLPESSELIAQELLMIGIDSAELLDSYVDNNMRLLRVSISTPWQDAVNYTDFLHELEASFERNVVSHLPQQQRPSIDVTGMAAIINRTVSEMLHSMLLSYITAFVFISIIMVILVRNIKLGIIVMLPNILPITMVMALMVIFGIPLDLFTLMIGSIAMGLIVDDSVHFLYRFRLAREEHQDTKSAIVSTLDSSGRALLITTCVLSCGFFVYMLSELSNIQYFGILTACCVVLALLADFIVLSAILLVLFPERKLSVE